MAHSLADHPPVSLAPDGTAYELPTDAVRRAAIEQLARDAEAWRASGREVVVVQGLGFVGVAVAAAISAARTPDGAPRYLVIGVDLPGAATWWKIQKLAAGECPIASPDPQLDGLIRDGVQRGNLRAIAGDEVYALADVVVVDVHLDVQDRLAARPDEVELDIAGFERAIRAVGRHMRPDALVLIETTVPVGASERIVLPALRDERAARGITAPLVLAHAYERVMPGPRYVDSIRRFWRVFAGIDAPSAARARVFLESFIDTEAFPLRELGSTTASELAKVLENSYRAANIAFIHEWTLLAERIGVNLFEVVDAIRMRKGTHDNIRQPGFGVGGYCLTKDSLLAQWSSTSLFGTDITLDVTLEALRINYRMPLHTLELTAELLDGRLSGRTVAVCGVSYLPEVGDTRNSPTELLVDTLHEAGATVVLHDPYLASWAERPEAVVHRDLASAVADADAIVLAVPHAPYLALSAGQLGTLTRARAIVDAQNILSDQTAGALRAAGWRLAGVGKGHWRARGYQSE
jgi:nucleotide sugar dehydrogenase